MKNLFVAALLVAGIAHGQTVEEVGDPDSFGRDVTYLGLGSVDALFLQPDCSDEIAGGLQCQTLLPPPAVTEFSLADADSIQLPARVSNSLLCFAITPAVNRDFRNELGTNAQAALTIRALLTIESPVLENPSLINPETGLPFGGKLAVTFITHHESFRMAPGEFDSKVTVLTRSCQGALISKRALIGRYGLTQTQANSFFNNRISVRLGLSGSARMIETSSLGYGIRLYGDRR